MSPGSGGVDEPRTDWVGMGEARSAVPSARMLADQGVATPKVGHPLGPLIAMAPLERPMVGRLYAGGLAAAVGAIVALAAGLVPSARHMGTHEQLGLPPCGFVVMTGLPCPTCGMTTAFAHTVRGQVIEAIRSQAAGFLIALVTLGAGVAAIVAVITGRRPSLNWYRIDPLRLVWWCFGLLIVAWGLKIVLWLTREGRSSGIGA